MIVNAVLIRITEIQLADVNNMNTGSNFSAPVAFGSFKGNGFAGLHVCEGKIFNFEYFVVALDIFNGHHNQVHQNRGIICQ